MSTCSAGTSRVSGCAASTASTSSPSPRGPIIRNTVSSQRRPAPASSSRTSAPGRRWPAGCCRRGRRCARRWSPPSPRRTGRPARRPRRGGAGPAGACAGRSQYAGHSANSVAKSSSASEAGAGVSAGATSVDHGEGGLEVGAAATGGADGGPRRTPCRAPPSRRSWVHSSRGAGAAAGSARELAGLLAVRRRRTAAGPCSDAALTKCRRPSAQVSTEAKPGVKPAVWESASTTGEPSRRSIDRPDVRRAGAPTPGAARSCRGGSSSGSPAHPFPPAGHAANRLPRW